MRLHNTDIEVVQADITTLKVDAVVNAANNRLLMGGGVAGAIKKRGGKAIEDEAVQRGPIEIGQALATAAGSLPARCVIHAATMDMSFATDEHKVRLSCRNALRVASEMTLQSIALPALGCGVGKFPLAAAAKIMTQEVYRHIRENRGTSLRKIVFCLYDTRAYELFNSQVPAYLRHVIEHIANGPFLTVDAIITCDGGVVIIERKNPPFGWALPGGFVDYGESVEDAVRREVREETGVELADMQLVGVYSDPGRDPRFHSVSIVFAGKAEGRPRAGDDAIGLKIISPGELSNYTLAFDHKQVLQDYLSR